MPEGTYYLHLEDFALFSKYYKHAKAKFTVTASDGSVFVYHLQGTSTSVVYIGAAPDYKIDDPSIDDGNTDSPLVIGLIIALAIIVVGVVGYFIYSRR
jgi:hypothetical protein